MPKNDGESEGLREPERRETAVIKESKRSRLNRGGKNDSLTA